MTTEQDVRDHLNAIENAVSQLRNCEVWLTVDIHSLHRAEIALLNLIALKRKL